MQTGQLIMPTASADRVALVLLASACAKGRLIFARHAAYLGGCASALFASLTVVASGRCLFL